MDKATRELRNKKLQDAKNIVETAKKEKRAFTEKEITEKEKLLEEVRAIDEADKADEEVRKLDIEKGKAKEDEKTEKEQRALERANFETYCRTGEVRSIGMGTNGAIIPKTIASQIIEKVREISPIYERATKFNVGGTLTFPIEDASLTAYYVDEFAEPTETEATFKTVSLESFVTGVRAKISKSLINNTQFDIVSYVIKKVAEAIALFLEKELLYGKTKANGIVNCTNNVEVAAVNADALIQVQNTVKQVNQANAVWIMNRNTFLACKKLKTTDGQYLLLQDNNLTNGFNYVILGKPVYISEAAEDILNTKTPIFYGDLSGLYVKLAQNVEIQLLMEKYAEQHAVGVCGFIEFDSDIVEQDKLVKLSIKTA